MKWVLFLLSKEFITIDKIIKGDEVVKSDGKYLHKNVGGFALEVSLVCFFVFSLILKKSIGGNKGVTVVEFSDICPIC